MKAFAALLPIAVVALNGAVIGALYVWYRYALRGRSRPKPAARIVSAD